MGPSAFRTAKSAILKLFLIKILNATFSAPPLSYDPTLLLAFAAALRSTGRGFRKLNAVVYTAHSCCTTPLINYQSYFIIT